MKKKNNNIIPLHAVEQSDRAAIIPGWQRGRAVPRLKELSRRRGSCWFTAGVPASLVDFIYRSSLKLGLRDRKLLFSRGGVKRGGRPVVTAVEIRELEWDVGTSVIIPRELNYRRTLRLLVDDEEYSVRLMEIIVLGGLLRLTVPSKPHAWYPAMAVSIITGGWRRWEAGEPGRVLALAPDKNDR